MTEAYVLHPFLRNMDERGRQSVAKPGEEQLEGQLEGLEHHGHFVERAWRARTLAANSLTHLHIGRFARQCISSLCLNVTACT